MFLCLNIIFWFYIMLILRSDGLFNFPFCRDGYGDTNGTTFSTAQVRAEFVNNTVVSGDITPEQPHLLFKFVLTLAKIVAVFSQMSPVFFQFLDVRLLLIPVGLDVGNQLLIDILQLLGSIGFGGLCLGLRFLPLPPPSEESTATPTDEQREQRDDSV